MLLLITGASGVGKSTVRTLVQPDLAGTVECVELLQLTTPPTAMTQVWRQQTAELAVSQAIQLQASGRHQLLCGDPVPAIEVAAAPSAPGLDGSLSASWTSRLQFRLRVCPRGGMTRCSWQPRPPHRHDGVRRVAIVRRLVGGRCLSRERDSGPAGAGAPRGQRPSRYGLHAIGITRPVEQW